ncbi:electron transport complex subunit RsxD [Gammaproteobacteria bacterium 42_54_T18]|nr:electron transport complex subunit RsxD [Gammaproteobacteria bacterium 42_54_T18]
MSVLHVTSPHVHRPFTMNALMRHVVYATIPGLIVLTALFGWGTLINVIFASCVAIAAEAVVLKLRKRPILFSIKDGSAVLTAVLLALAIPPTAPWWLTIIGIIFAIVIAKQLYGGLGSNPFNPAMIGYVLLLISFPLEMTTWIPAYTTEGVTSIPTLTQSFEMIFGSVDRSIIDGITMATPLDTFKTYAGNDLAKLQSASVLQGNIAGAGWEWVNVAFLMGGIYLIARKIITWHIPVAMLAGVFLFAGIFHIIDPDTYASPIFHLLSGGTMLGAFFIATDPVTAATSNKGKLIYGALIGVLIYVIRAWGGYPDAVAFAVLLINLCAPTIEYYTQPRAYGHKKANSGIAK